MTEKQRKINKVWERFEETEPEASTERLMEMTRQVTGADTAEIMNALFATGQWNETNE